MHSSLFSLFLLAAMAGSSTAQPAHRYQTDFPPEEFRDRHARVYEAVGPGALAILQGAAVTSGFEVFRQSNQLYYLCGIETPQAYLVLDGTSRRSTLYLPHRNPGRERNEGKTLSAEDDALVRELTGVDTVLALEDLSAVFRRGLMSSEASRIFTPFSPAELNQGSRDEQVSAALAAASDPWDSRLSREAHFIQLLRTRLPQFDLRDLSPLLDRLRAVKSPREIALLRRAGRLAGLGLMEAMRSTAVGVMEYQLDAAAQYAFLVNGARGPGYPSIVGGGVNAWMGHYFHNDQALKAGDLVLMDGAPDVGYYTSDMARMWPVNGRFTEAQRELCGFILAVHQVLLKRVRPGVTAEQILKEVRSEIEAIVERTQFSKPIYERAAREAVTFRGHLSHPVGMAVHDSGGYWSAPLVEGVVLAIDPMIWVPEEQLYIRIEDTVVVTEGGIENLTGFVPSNLDAIEQLMREPGLVELRPAEARRR